MQRPTRKGVDMDSTTIKPKPPESRALGMAIAVGLEPRMAYTIPQTSRYSGIPESWLRLAIKNGALAAKTPRGNLRGARIPVTEMDRYMEVHGDE